MHPRAHCRVPARLTSALLRASTGAWLVLALVAGCSGPEPRTAAGLAPDLILHGGRVWTGDPEQPEASAVAIAGGRIVAVGSDEELLPLATGRPAGASARLVDLDGRRVVPGLIDSHVHFLSGGEELLASDLRTAGDEEEFARRVGEVARRLPPGAWITAGSWDHENWPGGELPRRQTLDAHTPENPVLISRLDGHMAVANSLALRIAGVTRSTPDPFGGTIVRGEDGEPAGVLKDEAMSLVARHVPPRSQEERLRLASEASRHALALGVTCVHDMLSSHADLRVWQQLQASGEATPRARVYTPLGAHEIWREAGVGGGFGDDRLRLCGVKAFSDGSLGSSTALFFESYADSPGNYGLALADLAAGGDFEGEIASSAAAGLQIATHAIGDRAIRAVLDIYERLDDEVAALRARVEHAQHIHPDDVARFGELGVVASMQPFHAVDDGRWAEKRIGPRRLSTTYAFRDLLDTGAPLAFGSDWPVAPLSPMLGIHAAVTRRTLDGKNPDGWVPQQKITVEEALRAYTHGSARASFDEERLGRIRPGYLADLVVLDRDILTIDPEDIRRVRVVATLVSGRFVHGDATLDGGADETP